MGKQKKTASKTYEVRLSANALQNIDEITGYISFINQQPLNAIKAGDAIFETISRIELHPYAFKECELMRTKTKIYRQAVCLSWNIIYRVTTNEIIILGIIHSSRKPTAIKQLRKIR